ncbi:hypothetical protein SAMN04488056_12336 [Cohaesibacter marisflavi]|uniref:Transglycosylase SLT domain-containing protein n=1 Tax=Cohaesibacter marisflavi TaxID=655353 RepID=A0A1I5MVZ4_9HYPH|nr:hypothetical protein [Cohaesibacter marisflavi]SFP13276.1 hypothetical protein SAMN04488056_12336 [Cohaesibacter marisflavi]
MANRQARGLGKLVELNTQGQVSTKPGAAVDTNAGIWFAASKSLRQAGRTLSAMADRAMKRQQAADLKAAQTSGEQAGYAADLGTGSASSYFNGDMKAGIEAAASALKIDPIDLATVISYETGGTFDPSKKGPTTKWGTHRGLIQFGEPQAKQYGIDWNNPLASQLGENGAIVRFLRDGGVKPGMGLLDIYSVINAGAVGRYNASDEAAGGAPGTVRDKVQNQMDGHRAKAEQLFSGAYPAGTGRPSATGPALALRRGDTPMGEAYLASQNRALTRRLPLEVTQQLDALYEEHKDDPAALTQAFDEAENGVLTQLGKLSNNDPEMILLGQQTFAQKRRVYEKSARAAEDARVRDGERSDYDDTLKASRSSLQRQAYLTGNDVEAGADLEVSINESLASISDALDAGLISPEVAKRDRKAVLDTVTLARVDGVFDSLPDVGSKEAFIEGLKDSWTKEEELFKDLSLEQVQALERKYAGAITQEKRQTTATSKLEVQKMRSMVDDDLASIRGTGVGLSIDGEELTFDQVKATLGEGTAQEWQQKRQLQAGIFNATTGLDLMPATEMVGHLAALEPKAGASGYTDQATIHDTAQKEAQKILKRRKEDPALAVDVAFDDLKPIREQAYQGDLVAMEELIKGRLDAQEALGISDYAKAPLTNSELQVIAQPVAGAVDRQTWDQLFAKIDESYGPYADEVMTQILHWKGLHKEAATVATSMLRQTKLGERQSRLDAKSSDQKMGALETETAMDGDFDTVKWKASPNNSQINHLLANPDLADQFDDKFGSGASAFYIKAQERSKQQTQAYVDGLASDGVSINEDGSENYDPAKENAQ